VLTTHLQFGSQLSEQYGSELLELVLKRRPFIHYDSFAKYLVSDKIILMVKKTATISILLLVAMCSTAQALTYTNPLPLVVPHNVGKDFLRS